MLDHSAAAVCVLTKAEKADVERAVYSTVPPYRREAYNEFMAGCRLAADELPSRIRIWKDQVRRLTVGLIRNLPIDVSLPATPTAKYGADDVSLLADGVLGTISALFGTLYTLGGKMTARHIQNVHPVVGDENTQFGSNKVNLDWHVEDAFHPARPTWVSLLCLRTDPAAETRIAKARDLSLPLGVLKILRQRRFTLRIDESFSEEIRSTHVLTRVLTGPITNPQIALDPAYTICDHEDEVIALAAVASAANHAHQRITMLGGDLLIFDNRRVIHGRTAYQPRMDGSDRWLKRAHILSASKWTRKLSNGVIPANV